MVYRPLRMYRRWLRMAQRTRVEVEKCRTGRRFLYEKGARCIWRKVLVFLLLLCTLVIENSLPGPCDVVPLTFTEGMMYAFAQDTEKSQTGPCL